MKNNGTLEILTKIQFYHKVLNLTNINPLTNLQIFISMRLNLKMNVMPIPNVWFSSIFWIYADSGILTQFGPNFEANTDFYPIELEHELLILNSHIPSLENECELEFYDLDQTHEPTLILEPKLDLSFIPESLPVFIPFIVKPKSSIL